MRKELSKQKLKRGLTELAFGKVSDPISLLFMSEEEIVEKLPKLKLMNVSEIKRPKGGGMEIKFFDRIKAVEKLASMEDSTGNDGVSFYEALEQSAKSFSDGASDDKV